MPSDVGLKLGNHRRYIIYEVHLSNPNLVTGVNISNILKFHTASVLRKVNGGSMVIGMFSPGFIPKNKPDQVPVTI
jgi:hypothetical protein